MLPRSNRERRIPADLFLIFLFTLTVNAIVFVPVEVLTPLQVVCGLVFVAFVPGYTLSTAIFPYVQWDSSGGVNPDEVDHYTLAAVQRVALSVALSVVAVSLTGLALNYTPFGISLISVMVALDLVIALSMTVSIWRREFTRGLDVLSLDLVSDRIGTNNPGDVTLNTMLIVSLLVLAGSVTVVLTVPNAEEKYTEFYVVTENNGTLTTMEYPDEMTAGEPAELVVGVRNNEFERTDYTILVRLQRVERSSDGISVTATRELHRLELTVDHNATRERSHEVVPPAEGELLRLQYLLYRGTPPDDPSRESAYRYSQLWMAVDDDTA